MTTLLRLLTFVLMLLASLAVESGQAPVKDVPKQPTWSQLTTEQQIILAPLEKNWDQLPDSQRRRLLATARRYPKMTAAEQERFTRRLPEWSKLTLEERRLARERYKRFEGLPPQQQAEIKRRWAEQNSPENVLRSDEAQTSTAAPAEEQIKPEQVESKNEQ